MSIRKKKASVPEPTSVPSKKLKSNSQQKPVSDGSKQFPKKENRKKYEKKRFSDKKLQISKEKGGNFKTTDNISEKITSPKQSVPKRQKSKDFRLKSKLGQKVNALNKKKFGNKKGSKYFEEIPTKLLGKDGKPKWNEVKQEKKKLKEKRKTKRSGLDQYNLTVEAKSLWEKLRDSNISVERKEQLVNELFMLLKSEILNVVHSHDMARVVQWMLKLGSASVRTSICEALCANKSLVLCLKSKYASFCVKRALSYGSNADRNHLIQACVGHFLKLLNHAYSHKIVELMYSTYANAETRKNMHREIYGEMHMLLSSDICNIKDIPENIKPAILSSTKANLMKLLAKKQHLKSTLLQSVLKDYLSSCSSEDCNEILELIQGDILELLNSKEGSRVALKSVWHATNKMKKAIVKNCKGKVKEIATSEFGYILLLALFDCIDDTVLIKKALIPELMSEAEDIAKDEWGRKVILYLVAHRNPAFFHPQQIEVLAKGDLISSKKKDARVREQEMLEAVSAPLLKKMEENPHSWLGESSISMVSLAIMKSGKGEALKAAFESIVEYMLNPDNVVEVNERKVHIVEHGALHLVFKKLILQDKSRVDQAQEETFSMILASSLSENSLRHILQFNRGCFLLVLLFESNNKKVCKTLKSKISEEMKTFLQKQETTGSKILLKKLKGE